ncbi:MAG: DUF1365 domain-containing protein [Paracoccaceae bacterium]
MSHTPQYIAGTTTHARLGRIKNTFRYGVDYVLIDPEARLHGPLLFSRNRFNLASVWDRDHGGPLKAGRGAIWVREVLRAHGLADQNLHLLLLTQPSFLGYGFNPVSFWLALKNGALIAAIAEVSTPFGDRHSYLCHLPGFAPITRDSRITTPKSLHVSPFQEIKGSYEFAFDFSDEKLAFRITHRNGDEGVIATLSGQRAALTNAALFKASLRRPFGAIRTSFLIHWQALRLKLKGAKYRRRPSPPKSEVT